jgi:hypothetical protein
LTKKEREIRKNAIAKSRAGQLGKTLEKIVPMFPGFGHHPYDVRPIFDPSARGPVSNRIPARSPRRDQTLRDGRDQSANDPVSDTPCSGIGRARGPGRGRLLRHRPGEWCLVRAMPRRGRSPWR